jgi:hypothetical protein
MTPEETVKPKRTRKPKEVIICHVHDNCDKNDRQSIHDYVCRNLETTVYTDGKHYCLLHLPTIEKDIDKFNEEFQKRLHEHDDAISKIEDEFPDDRDKQNTAKSEQGIDYNFRYVWFPNVVDLYEHNFKADAYFIWASFSGDTSFSSVTFNYSANFSSATFSSSGDFSCAIFSDSAKFSFANFTGFADFSFAIFSDSANFSSATFTGFADFDSATFTGSGFFNLATFEEKSQLFFVETNFNKRVHFNYTNFKGYAAFEGNHNNRVFVGKEALLELQKARIDDATKISFHSVRLEPSWFVNVNASEFVFTDCKWRYANGKRLKVKTEIKNLRDRRVSDNPHEILTKACWQLADNHEESKSLSKASMFRKFANESKRLATPWYLQPFTLHWWYYAVSFYGESWRRALVVLVCILSAFAFLFTTRLTSFDYGKERPRITRGYTDVLADNLEILKTNICGTVNDSEQFRNMNRCEAVSHSLAVASFQRPEPKAEGFFTKFLITLEAILATLQAALLALAIRRKFMR